MSWLRTIAAFAFALAFVCQPATASAFVPASPESRVGAFEVVADTLAGGLGAASRGEHQGIGEAYEENASGYRFAAGGAAPEMSRLLGNATQVFRNGPLTNVGRALTKHPNIIGESGNIIQKLGGAANVNTAGARALENIMQTGTMTTKSTAAYGDIIQYTLESGLGARFSATTGEFIGFIGRGL